MKKKIISMMLSLALVITAVPSVPVNATETAVDIETVDSSVEEVQTISESFEQINDANGKDTYSLEAEYSTFNISANGKVIGSNNVAYDNVTYLSYNTIAALPSDVKAAYITFCDEVALWNEAGNEIKDVVMAVDNDGNLHITASFPSSILKRYENELKEEFIISDTDEEETATEEISLEETTVEEAETEETTTGETITEETSVEETTVEEAETEETITEETDVEETTVEEAETEETTTEETSVEETTVEETETEGITAEETDVEETTVEETETEEVNTDEIEVQEVVITSENMELLAVMEEETFEVAEDVQVEKIIDLGYENTGDIANINSTLSDKKHFYNQLNSEEKVIYDAAYKNMTSGKNSFTYKARYVSDYQNLVDVFQAVSAVIMTKPTAGEWMDLSQEGEFDFSATYYRGNPIWNFTFAIDKSKHYKSSLVSESNKKIKELATAAQEYAVQNYPKTPVYGIVKYFDKWICENNYYSDYGLYPQLGDVEEYFYCHSSFGILLKGYGVCESYALAMTRLLDAVGIPNMYATGDAGGGHAWNYVKMPDGKWYLLDSTWNDPLNESATSTGKYLLCADDGIHKPEGNRYNLSRAPFKFVDVSKSAYKPSNETLSFLQSEYNLKVKENVTLTCSNTSYVEGLDKKWSSNNTKVAKVDKNGKVTAVNSGTATITMTAGGVSATCTVNVHKVDKVTFADNKKPSLSFTDGISEKSKPQKTFVVNVSHKVDAYTIEQLIAKGIYKAPTVVSDKEEIASVSCTVKGNDINVIVQPKTMGKAKITLTFEGKKATLNYTVKEQISSSWFKVDNKAVTYTGAAFKPAVEKTASAPAKLKFKVTHVDNKNAGTGKVIISGTGNYGGKIEYKYAINQADISTATFAKCTESKPYVGAPIVPATTIKLGKKTLSAKTDYELRYNGMQTAENVGAYTVTVYGKGNYKGKVTETKTFEIKQTTIDKVKVTVPSKVKYTGSVIKPEPVVSIGKNKLSNMNYYISYHAQDKKAKDKVGAKVDPKEPGDYVVVITVEGYGVKNKNIVNTSKKTQIVKPFKIVK